MLNTRKQFLAKASMLKPGVKPAGQEGVRRCLDIIRTELDMSMAMCGERSLEAAGRHNLVRVPASFEPARSSL